MTVVIRVKCVSKYNDHLHGAPRGRYRSTSGGDYVAQSLGGYSDDALNMWISFFRINLTRLPSRKIPEYCGSALST